MHNFYWKMFSCNYYLFQILPIYNDVRQINDKVIKNRKIDWRGFLWYIFAEVRYTCIRKGKIRRPEISSLDTALPVHTLVEWSLGDSICVPNEIRVRPVVGFEPRTSRYAVERATTGPTRTDFMVHASLNNLDLLMNNIIFYVKLSYALY